MTALRAEALILAASETVWDVLTDAGNYPVWGSGITAIEGQIFDGATIRVRTRGHRNKSFRLRVRLSQGHRMTWAFLFPLGLLTLTRTCTLTNYTGMTHLAVQDKTHGPLQRLLPGIFPPSSSFADEVKFRVELLSFHLNGGLFPGTGPRL